LSNLLITSVRSVALSNQAMSGRTAYFAIRQFPLASHPHARLAANAAICAGMQHQFPRMHRQLLESSQWLVDTNMVAVAVNAGVTDTAAFRVCLRDHTTDSVVEADLELGRRLQVTGTPTFFDSERRYTGMLPESALGDQARGNAALRFRGPTVAETQDTLM
jgi:protein-disulfide isomerase